MANSQPAIETLEGRVSQSRPDGIKLQDAEGQESEWLNVSQYHPLELIPERGALIEVQVTRSGRTTKPYIVTLSPLNQEPLPLRDQPPLAQPSPSSSPPSPSATPPTALPVPPSPLLTPSPLPPSLDREELMTRMSALKSAVALLHNS